MIVYVAVIVDVIAPVIVAVHVHVNANVEVIDQTKPRDAANDNAGMLSFQKLDVYRCSIEFLALANRIRAAVPKEHADLIDQLRRAAQSVPQNIAEGAGRATRADKARHYTIARGSAMESAAHLDVMRIDELVEEEAYARGVELLERVVAMLTKMIEP